MITAYSLGKKYWWIPWSLSMKGCKETERGVRRWAQHPGKSPTPAASWFQKQDGNIRREEIAKKNQRCPDLHVARPTAAGM